MSISIRNLPRFATAHTNARKETPKAVGSTCALCHRLKAAISADYKAQMPTTKSVGYVK